MTAEPTLLTLREALAAGDGTRARAIGCGLLAAPITDPRIANAAGLALLETLPDLAVQAFERGVALDAEAVPLWLNLATARRACGDRHSELVALEQVLVRDPYQPAALVAKADALEAIGDLAAASRVFAALASAFPIRPEMPEALRNAITHGADLIARLNAEAEARLGPEIARAIETVDPAFSTRARLFADIRFGRKRAYLPQPTGTYYPHLPAVEFFDRAQFPWFAALEAATDAIADELVALLSDSSVAAEPYVRFAPGEPVNQWAALNHSPDWSALFLKKDGVDDPSVRARCPRTAAVVDALPLMDMPRKAPTVLFSLLTPGTRIPPHTGSTNVRATVHLPLIVPPDCGFRVGSDVREWRYGEAWGFDDTIEHEAWNNSDQLRAVLILDAWNPYLSAPERAVARAAGA